jgi:pyruvate,water dikinase
VTITDADVTFPTPEQLPGFWNLDKMHSPRPVHPLSFDLVVKTLTEGFTTAQAEYDCPVMVDYRDVNHYFYVSFHPLTDEAEIADRMSRYHDTLAKKVPGIGKRWEEEWKPALIAKNYAEKDADYSAMSDEQLSAKLHEMTDHMRHMWWIHGNINFVLLSSSAFCDLYDEVMQPDDPTEAYQALQGFHTRSVDASRGMWELRNIVKASPTLLELFRTHEPKDIASKLAESDDGRAFKTKLDEYLHEYGWRSDAVYDLADVPWREDPSIPLASVSSFIDLPDSEDPEILYQRGVKLREELLAKAREKLADDPERLERFNTLYEAAQYSFPITEDHAFYIDQLGVVLFRRFVRAVGRRLAEKGVIAEGDDVFLLHEDEVHDALTNGGDRQATVAERKASIRRASQVPPPVMLGTPPPPPQPDDPVDPFMDAIVVRLLGVTPPDENPDPNIIRAVAGSPGVYTGTARVVKSLSEAGALEEGEVMVCEMTLPPWVPLFSIAGAIVADVGGVLSHCAIVAREFDVPAVVGSQVGTTVIQTGQTITVDGTRGVVYLDGRTVEAA